LNANSMSLLYKVLFIALLAIGIYVFYYVTLMENNPYGIFKKISNYSIIEENYIPSQYSCISVGKSNVSKVCTEIFNFTSTQPNSSNATKMPMRIVVAYYLFLSRNSLQEFMQNILDNNFLQVSNVTYNNLTFTYSIAQFVNGYKVFTGYVPKGASIFEIAALDNNTDSNSTEAEYIIEHIISIIANQSNR